MKGKTFYGIGKLNKRYILVPYKGEIFTYNGMTFGLSKDATYYSVAVIELSSGLSCVSTEYQPDTIKEAKEKIGTIVEAIKDRLKDKDLKKYAKIYQKLLRKEIKNERV